MATRSIVPRATGEGGIGTTLLRWATGFINALTVTTINALTLAAAAVGFTISGGTTSKTLTVTADTALDEAVAMSAKAPKTDVIKADGIANRTLRCINFVIQDGTEVAHIKVETSSSFNGDVNAAQDNIGKDNVPTGVFSLSADGSELTLLSSGITGDAVLAFTTIPYNLSQTPLMVSPGIVAGGISLYFQNLTTGAAVDLTTLVNTGRVDCRALYITSE